MHVCVVRCAWWCSWLLLWGDTAILLGKLLVKSLKQTNSCRKEWCRENRHDWGDLYLLYFHTAQFSDDLLGHQLEKKKKRTNKNLSTTFIRGHIKPSTYYTPSREVSASLTHYMLQKAYSNFSAVITARVMCRTVSCCCFFLICFLCMIFLFRFLSNVQCFWLVFMKHWWRSPMALRGVPTLGKSCMTAFPGACMVISDSSMPRDGITADFHAEMAWSKTTFAVTHYIFL